MSIDKSFTSRNKTLKIVYRTPPSVKNNNSTREKKSSFLATTRNRIDMRDKIRRVLPPKLSLDQSILQHTPRAGMEALTPRKSIKLNTSRHSIHSSLNTSQSVKFPMSPRSVLKTMKDKLTGFELSEILDYPQVYYIGRKKTKQFDDHKGNYTIVTGDHLHYRYEILNVIGKGAFGRVCKCMDHKLNELVAVKIIKNKEKYYRQGLVEVEVLAHLNKHDEDDSKNIVRIKAAFTFREHLCIAFELLSINLFEFIRFNKYEGMSMGLCKRFAEQILTSLQFIRTHNIIHCDLKPENILLSQEQNGPIKLIDFGSSCFHHEKIYNYIQSRFYRAPEIMLAIPYTSSIDMWSFGCILIEMYTGIPIFPGDNENDQFMRLMEVIGLPPADVVDRGSRKNVFIRQDGEPFLSKSESGVLRIPGSLPLKKLIKCNDPHFFDFLGKILVWDPENRMTPEQALKHPWLLEQPTNYIRRRRTHKRSFLSDDIVKRSRF